MSYSMPKDEPAVIAELQPNDVVCGRGELAVINLGNVRFRQLVAKHRAEYRESKRRLRKDSIARDVVLTIQERGGRFLQRVECRKQRNSPKASSPGKGNGSSALEAGAGEITVLWKIADEEMVLLKVKQALRGKNQPAPDEVHEDAPPKERSAISSKENPRGPISSVATPPAAPILSMATPPAAPILSMATPRASTEPSTFVTMGDRDRITMALRDRIGTLQGVYPSSRRTLQPIPAGLEALARVNVWLALQTWHQNLVPAESITMPLRSFPQISIMASNPPRAVRLDGHNEEEYATLSYLSSHRSLTRR